jgi:hypothetical protein
MVSGKGGWETGYRWDSSKPLLDPYAPLVAGRNKWCKQEELENFKKDVSGLKRNKVKPSYTDIKNALACT